MIIQTITRTYSRSINTRTYGAPESWIKIEATYTGVVESGDDPVKVSQLLYEQAQKEVVANMGEIITKIRAGATAPAPATTPTAPVTPPAASGPANGGNAATPRAL